MAVVAKVDPDVLDFLTWVSAADAVTLATVLRVGRERAESARQSQRDLDRLGVSASFRNALDTGLKQIWALTLPAMSEGNADPGRDRMYLRALTGYSSRAIKRRAALSEESFATLTEPFQVAGYSFDVPRGAAE